jgi:hypothetical protein
MLEYFSDGIWLFWLFMAVVWVVSKVADFKPAPTADPDLYSRQDFYPIIPTGIHDRLTIVEAYESLRDKKFVICLRNDATGEKVTLKDDTRSKVMSKACAQINEWRDRHYAPKL